MRHIASKQREIAFIGCAASILACPSGDESRVRSTRSHEHAPVMLQTVAELRDINTRQRARVALESHTTGSVSPASSLSSIEDQPTQSTTPRNRNVSEPTRTCRFCRLSSNMTIIPSRFPLDTTATFPNHQSQTNQSQSSLSTTLSRHSTKQAPPHLASPPSPPPPTTPQSSCAMPSQNSMAGSNPTPLPLFQGNGKDADPTA